ncbi:MAG: hypothetical protein KF851_07360 [Pirellulaceae bacterium]|nr:hypothetical protein [Pirellulaceae bacterium]
MSLSLKRVWLKIAVANSLDASCGYHQARKKSWETQKCGENVSEEQVTTRSGNTRTSKRNWARYPYGVHDIAQNEAGGLSELQIRSSLLLPQSTVGVTRNWEKVRYSKGKRVPFHCRQRRSNSPRTDKAAELQNQANKTGLIIEVCHSSPGTTGSEQDRTQTVLPYHSQLAGNPPGNIRNYR